MTGLDGLLEWFAGRGRVMVALSGGVDSALVAYAAHRALGDGAIAVTADYKTLAQDELADAKRVCSEIGMQHMLITYDELENADFVRNDSRRCFYCKTELAGRMAGLAAEHGVKVIVDGTNLDDLSEYRPGIAAMRDGGILSPLADAGFRKEDVRREARLAGISVHDKPSNSCLASRVPWGQRVTAEKLARIEMGESLVKSEAGVAQVRVRDMDGAASIEVEPGDVARLSGMLAELDAKLRMIGFKSATVDPLGYRPGGINVAAD
ncbi:ATP-utilizing enzyme of the PP-loop superfamily [Cenarchaeum symbiosum A]|uniref:ATP-utilizing enzyme of the PP-loop superfamily n=1 Tax=Cenarchaeum symbiosum (strain A) TaxID=414004 RepID=A0RXX6_CENSY|nr:ATP-utilizing enzyme of the PP-loop superfamily [Cenarchaeum symbiosum A]